MTANSFGIARSTVSVTIHKVARIMREKLQQELIHMPHTDEQMEQVVLQYQSRFGLPGVFGAVDGSHFKILSPNVDHTEYHCYKGYHSINVQAICDCTGYFQDVYVAMPGRTHDARLFQVSPVSGWIAKSELGRYESDLCTGIPNYLLGDPAYPLLPYLMKEIPHPRTDDEAHFNTLLRSGRNPIEKAFGRIKSRWRYVGGKIEMHIEYIPDLIFAAFLLHNFLESPLYRAHANSSRLNNRVFRAIMQKADDEFFAYGRGPKNILSIAIGGQDTRNAIVAYIGGVEIETPHEPLDPIIDETSNDTDPESDFELDENVFEECQKYADNIDFTVN